MSDERINTEQPSPAGSVGPVNLQPNASEVMAAGAPGAAEKLDAIEDIDLLLEEIENKIAPLALA